MNRRSERLHRLLYPRSIVYVGGRSVEPAIEYSRKLGFQGNRYVINSRHGELAGVPCVPSAEDLPEVPDAAFVLVPSEGTSDVVRALAEAGTGAAVVGSSGFAESGRRELQDSVVAAAGDMPVLGPNCPGFANFLNRTSAILDNMGLHECSRGVAVVSNGGAYMTDMACSYRSMPLAMMVGLGNQASVTIDDVVDVVLDDDRVTAVNLYFESLSHVAGLSEVAEKAHRKGIPVVVLRSGRTKSGSRATATHTAALASDAVVSSALFRRLGFIEVETGCEAIETLKMLTLTGRPVGRRVGFATSSGSYAAMGADLAEDAGLELPPLKPERRETLKDLMESFVVPNNPLDLATAQFWPDRDQRLLFDAFLESGFDVAVQCMSFPAENTWEDESWYRSSSIFAESATAIDLPTAFISTIQEGLPKRAREMLIGLGVAPLQGLRDGLRAVAHSAEWSEFQGKNPGSLRIPEPPHLIGKSRFLDEITAKRRLQDAGVPIPEGVVWDTDEAPEGIGWPVVLKLCSPEIVHKSDIGGVVLNLKTRDELLAARNRMRVRAERSNIRGDRFLIEPQIEGGVAELLIGIRHVAEFGQVLTIATGGVHTELLQDAATLILPTGRNEVESALRCLKLFPLLDGWRGSAKADVPAAVDTISTICDFANSSRDTLLELEINPLILRAEGQGVCAADAVIKIIEK